MGKSVVITTRLDGETLATVDAIAKRCERTRAWIVAKAIKQYVEEEAAFSAFLKEGEDAIDRGEFFTQDEMEAWFEARYKTADVA